MSILNVNQIQPVGSGQTVTISAANITASSSTISASSFVGPLTGDATGLSGSPTLSGITSVSTTNLTVNGNRYPSAGPLSNRNLIINGAMQVAQRGTSGTAGGYETVDRFLNDHGGGGAITQSQVALTTGTPYDEGFRYFWRQTNTTASTAAGRYVRAFQYIEAQNVANSGWNYVSPTSYITLSFWVRSSVAQEFYGEIVTHDGTGQNYPFSTGSLSAGTWTKVTKTIPGNSNITVNNDNGQGLRVELVPFYGTNFTDSGTSVDTWVAWSGSARVPDMTSTWASTTNATFDVTGVQLEVGEVATPFEHRSYGDELARCQRYFYRLSGTRLIGGYKRHDAQTNFRVTTPVPMRQLPSASLPTTGNFTNFQSSLGATQSSPNTYEFNTGSNDCFVFSVQSTWSSTHAFVPSYEAFVANFDAEL